MCSYEERFSELIRSCECVLSRVCVCVCGRLIKGAGVTHCCVIRADLSVPAAAVLIYLFIYFA